MNCADDVNDVGLGDGDNVFWLYGDVFRRVGGVHNAFDVDGGDAVEAGGIVGRARQGDLTPFEAAGDFDTVARVLPESAGHGEDFEEILAALQLMNAGSLDCADDRDGLAAELGDGYGDVWLLEIFLEALL